MTTLVAIMRLVMVPATCLVVLASASGWQRDDASVKQAKCLQGNECSSSHFCFFELGGGCTAPGYCKDKPQTCEEERGDAVVCGCDGKTYGNLCLAQREGMSVRSDGSCESMIAADANLRGRLSPMQLQPKQQATITVQLCGGANNSTCSGAKKYCEYQDGTCGLTAGESGVCTTKPFICPAVYKPVCGCDNKTYSNSCYAQALGMSIKDSTRACAGDQAVDDPPS